MTEFAGVDLSGSSFDDVDLSRSTFREADLSGVRMRGVLLLGADIDGAIGGLRLNGVDVAPLVEAELDRLHPERTVLRPTTAAEARAAWAVVERLWEPTMRRAAALPDEALHRSVDDEWSFTETLRHLVFVTDAWIGHAARGLDRPFHPSALPTPSFAEVADVRARRVADVRAWLATLDDLDATVGPNPAPGFPPPAARTVRECLLVALGEEWTHHRFAIRDLAAVE